ncbi:MAG: hypothetical protein IJ774_00510 [Selenomonadaceae bacterium]|nr:hypothetical protein [Selenomonadaceae bacterium]
MAKKDDLGDAKVAPVKVDDTKTSAVPDDKKFNAAVENLRTARKAMWNVQLGM